MVRKIIQWVPIDGTRWRNEFVNGHENRGVGLHCGVAHDGAMAPLVASKAATLVTMPTQRAIVRT